MCWLSYDSIDILIIHTCSTLWRSTDNLMIHLINIFTENRQRNLVCDGMNMEKQFNMSNAHSVQTFADGTIRVSTKFKLKTIRLSNDSGPFFPNEKTQREWHLKSHLTSQRTFYLCSEIHIYFLYNLISNKKQPQNESHLHFCAFLIFEDRKS